MFCIEKSETCNIADDNTLYATGENIGDVSTCLEVGMEMFKNGLTLTL